MSFTPIWPAGFECVPLAWSILLVIASRLGLSVSRVSPAIGRDRELRGWGRELREHFCQMPCLARQAPCLQDDTHMHFILLNPSTGNWTPCGGQLDNLIR